MEKTWPFEITIDDQYCTYKYIFKTTEIVSIFDIVKKIAKKLKCDIPEGNFVKGNLRHTKKCQYRVWNPKIKDMNYIEDTESVQKFIGMYDKNLKPIYENDVIKFSISNQEKIGQVFYSHDSAAFFVDVYPIMNLDIDKFEVIGNMNLNYTYDEDGELCERFYYE